MANKPLRPCKHPGCRELVSSGYCPQHQPERADREESAQWHGLYSLPIWTDTLRPEQLMREPFCRECAKRGERVYAVVVDHIIPHRGVWRLFANQGNLQSLCERCHNRKTALERQNRKKSSRK